MAAPHGATLDQAGCVRTSASASHNPYSAPGSGTGKTINFRDQKPIGKRDPAHERLARENAAALALMADMHRRGQGRHAASSAARRFASDPHDPLECEMLAQRWRFCCR